MPKSGPRKSWLDEFGRTPGCTACSNEKLHGRHHNKACKARYLAWQKSQREESTEIAPIDLEKHSSSSNPIPSSLPIEYQPPSRVRADEDIPSLAAPPLYTPSEAPSAGDVSLGDVEDDSMEVDLHEFIDPAIHSQVFATMFSDSPEVHHNRNGTLPLLNGRQVLHPFYLPKIGEATKYDEFQLGGKKVFLARPIQVRSENTYEPLSVDKTVEARLVELEALERVKFGRVIDKATAEKFCKDNDIKVIGTRWIVGPKEINGESSVRARLVVQQIATGDAAQLGFSSSTPSGESIRPLLTFISTSKLHLSTLDVSTAFMNAPLPPGVQACVRLPSDISLDSTSHSPSYAVLFRALNGLRCASRAWLNMASQVCLEHGLHQCPSETCTFKGEFVRGSFKCQMILVIYVDDVLMGCSDERGPHELKSAFLTRVEKIKITGELPLGKPGTLKFLGREITRYEGTNDLFMRVPPEYLQEVVKDLSSTPIPPKFDLDKAEGKENEQLTPEAASRYRSILGRVAWWIQSNLHLLRFASLLATGQAVPCFKHERALFRVLRFLKSQLHFHQRFVSDGSSRVGETVNRQSELQLYVDASWGNPSVSGYAIFWKSSLIKAVSRVQQCISLSACEAELIATSHGAQETLGIIHLISFLQDSRTKPVLSLEDFVKTDVEELPTGMFTIQTDSRSGQGFLSNDGFSRRTRHLALAFNFLQRLIYHKILIVEWVSTKVQVADILTKITDRDTFERLRTLLGYLEISQPEVWQVEKGKTKGKCSDVAINEEEPIDSFVSKGLLSSHIHKLPSGSLVDQLQDLEKHLRTDRSRVLVLVELCTAFNSGFGPQHLKKFHAKRLFVVQVTKDHDIIKSHKLLEDQILDLKKTFGFPLIVWLSPPCTGGSPAQNLVQEKLDERVLNLYHVFRRILRKSVALMNLADIKIMELSIACQFWKSDAVNRFSEHFQLGHTSYFDRCCYCDDNGIEKARHVYRLQSNLPLFPRKTCQCVSHIPFNKQNLRELGSYPADMTADIAQCLGKAVAKSVSFQ